MSSRGTLGRRLLLRGRLDSHVGLLLAKFLNNAPLTGVRRALGASRRQVFMQHLVEVGVISSIGAVLGLALGGLLLLGLRALYTVDPTDAGGTQALA